MVSVRRQACAGIVASVLHNKSSPQIFTTKQQSTGLNLI
jgi:hypothetical protein